MASAESKKGRGLLRERLKVCFQIVDTVVCHEFLYKSGQEMVRAPSGVKGSNQILKKTIHFTIQDRYTQCGVSFII